MNRASFPKEKRPEFKTKMGEIHELFVLALSLLWFAGATPKRKFCSAFLLSVKVSLVAPKTLRFEGHLTQNMLQKLVKKPKGQMVPFSRLHGSPPTVWNATMSFCGAAPHILRSSLASLIRREETKGSFVKVGKRQVTVRGYGFEIFGPNTIFNKTGYLPVRVVFPVSCYRAENPKQLK